MPRFQHATRKVFDFAIPDDSSVFIRPHPRVSVVF
jgi:hypothetical protein